MVDGGRQRTKRCPILCTAGSIESEKSITMHGGQSNITIPGIGFVEFLSH